MFLMNGTTKKERQIPQDWKWQEKEQTHTVVSETAESNLLKINVRFFS